MQTTSLTTKPELGGAVIHPAIDQTVQIVCSMRIDAIHDAAKIIADVYTAVTALYGPPPAAPEPELVPVVPIKKSITADFIICLEDGLRFKSLKRHLRTEYNLSPDQYRERWGLSPDYPMVAPNYSATRSQLAKAHGLGRKVYGLGRKA